MVIKAVGFPQSKDFGTDPGLKRTVEFNIPKETLRELARSPEAKQEVHDSLGKVRRLCVELGLVNRFTVHLWKLNNIWD